MDIVGITFNREIRDYIAVRTLKISKWIDPHDFSQEIIFRLTIEHNFEKNGFKKLKEFCMYFKYTDLDDIDEEYIKILKKKKRKDISENRNHELEKRISPLKGYDPQVQIKEVKLESNHGRKRVKVILDDYSVSEENKRKTIKFLLRFKKSIEFFENVEFTVKKFPWFYDCLIGPYLVQALKWEKKEFMPPLEFLEVWLQVPKELYRSLSQVNVLPVGHFEQMFLLGKENAEKFREAKQLLAEENTLCINWTFSDVSISNHPEEIRVTCGLRKFTEEEDFINRFEKTKESPIIILREILYACKVKTLDFKHIISGTSNENLKNLLEIFNIMVFQRYSRYVEENLYLLLQYLEPYRNLPHGKEFFIRYNIFYTLICCRRSDDFFSDRLLSMFGQVQELEDALDPDYITLIQDFNALSELTKKSQYKDEILLKIDNLDYKWGRKLIYPDRYILIDILSNWKDIIEKEYKEEALLPEIEVDIKTRHLVFSDQVGFVLSVKNIGAGMAKEVHARLIQTNDYEIIAEKSETKALLTTRGRVFEPELVIKPKNAKETTILYEIHYKDARGRDAKRKFEERVNFIEEEIPFQKIDNPYIIGGIVRESRMFYGREELLEDIIDSFRGKHQTNPIFLYGQRRTGKTSILFHLKERLKNEFSPVFFDTMGIFGRKSFYEDLMEKIKEELGFTDIKIPEIEDNPFNRFKNEFYAKFKQELEGKKIVLMIDEYQRIDEFITKGDYDDSIIDFLSALVQDGIINIILAGYKQPDELQNSKWKDLMRFFATMNVSFLNRENAVKLICDPIQKLMKYDEAGIEKILSLSGRHPYFVQLICHTMVEYHNRNEVSLIGCSSVAEHVLKCLDKGENVFWDITVNQTQETERKILFSLYSLMEEEKIVPVHKAKIEKNLVEHGETIERTEIEKALSHLERKEIIRKSVEHPDYYEFTVNLYKHWIKWNL